MGLWLKQSTAITVKIGPFIDDADGKTAEVALTLTQADIRLSKNGANIAQKNEANNATTDELGYYDCPLDATDTGTLGILQLFVHEAGALPVFHEYMVVPANVWDSFFGADKLDVNTAELANIDFGATMKASINTEVDNALNTAIPGGPTADSVNERVKAIDDKLPTNYIMGSSVVTDKDDEIDAIKAKTDLIPADIATQLDTNVPAIKAKTDNLPSDPADESLLEAEINANEAKIDTLQTAVTAIQNNTRFTAAVPTYMTKPDAGNEAYRIACNMYDTIGNMEDPDDNEVMIRVMEDDGTYMTANLYKENTLTNALDNATDQVAFPAASGWKALEREATGKFYCFYKVTSVATEETLTSEFGWEESNVAIYQSRSTEVADIHGDLTAILADTVAIKAKTDNLPVDPADESLLETEINANETKIDTLQTDITAIKGYIDTEIAAIKAVTDTLTLAAIADAVHDEVTEGTITMRQAVRLMLSMLASKSSGGGTNTLVYQDYGGTKPRLTFTVDANGNRSAVVSDAT